jgi:hypothetical protein
MIRNNKDLGDIKVGKTKRRRLWHKSWKKHHPNPLPKMK